MIDELKPTHALADSSANEHPSNGNPESLSWRVHPMIERKWSSLGAIVVVGAVGVIIQKMNGEFLFAVLAIFVLLLSLNRFFLPSSFELTRDGITARYPLKTLCCKWEEVDCWVGDSKAAWIRLKGYPKKRDVQLILGNRHHEVLKYLAQRANGRTL